MPDTDTDQKLFSEPFKECSPRPGRFISSGAELASSLAKISTFDQNPERQLEDVDVDRIFSDKASGKDVRRPQLKALMDFVRDGDTVIVHSMDRLARNLDDLRRIVQTLTEHGVYISIFV